VEEELSYKIALLIIVPWLNLEFFAF